jgi:hypothetical protein
MLLAALVGLTLSQGTTMGNVRALVPPDLRLPDMPPETENGWTLAVAASGGSLKVRTVDSLMDELAPLVAKEGGEQKPTSPDASILLANWPKAPTPADLAQAEEALRVYAARFRFLEAAVARPVWAMPRYDNGYQPRVDEFRDDFRSVAGFRALARALKLRAQVRLAQNRPEEAVADAILIRRMGVRLSGGYGGVINHLVGEAVASIATSTALNVAYHGSVNEAQVARLQRAWEEDPRPSDLPNALRHEFDFQTLRTLAASPTTFPVRADMPKISAELTRELKRRSFLDRPATIDYAAKYLRIAIENRNRPWTQRAKIEPVPETAPPIPPGSGEPKEGKPLTKAQEKLFLAYLRLNPNPLGRQLIDVAVASYDAFEGAERRREAFNRMAITAFSLRVASLRDGKLPVTLDSLVSTGLLPAVPTDPFGPGALRYDPARRVLWALGTNGKDDGGQGRSFSSAPDVVIVLP